MPKRVVDTTRDPESMTAEERSDEIASILARGLICAVRASRSRMSKRGKADEVDGLLAACSSRPTGIRNRAMLAVLYRSGLRINEALSLRPKDLDARNGAIRVLNGKGGKCRTVGMDATAFGSMQTWLTIRDAKGLDDRAALFCMMDGAPINPSYIRVLLPRLARKAGIAKRVHAHGLRHTHAAELRGEGVDVGLSPSSSATPASQRPPAISTTLHPWPSSMPCGLANGDLTDEQARRPCEQAGTHRQVARGAARGDVRGGGAQHHPAVVAGGTQRVP